ncbi:hypothetical protein B0T24DRAFT_299635 [Lasiosphaeria ovina]|uniref:Uncharacterized protein n=1 Tax=Lasiosphaeria ovina TaxID=92902 RepID=A0AAE0K708_9PEZI|nr:hypothetical protein B0T24DRAFT_299635 [Lasiosphaeria ovina]
MPFPRQLGLSLAPCGVSPSCPEGPISNPITINRRIPPWLARYCASSGSLTARRPSGANARVLRRGLLGAVRVRVPAVVNSPRPPVFAWVGHFLFVRRFPCACGDCVGARTHQSCLGRSHDRTSPSAFFLGGGIRCPCRRRHRLYSRARCRSFCRPLYYC